MLCCHGYGEGGGAAVLVPPQIILKIVVSYDECIENVSASNTPYNASGAVHIISPIISRDIKF